MADVTRRFSSAQGSEDLLEALDDEVADLETVVDWQHSQLERLRFVVFALVEALLAPDDDIFTEAQATLYPGGTGDGPRVAESIQWTPTARRARRFTREELLELASKHSVRRPGIRQWPKNLLLKTLREEGVIGNARVLH